jgi:cyanate permease
MAWQALIYGGLLGLTNGFGMTLQAVVWPNYFGRRHLGSIRSVATSGMIASAAIGPLPFGWLFDLTGSYSLGIAVFLALPVISAAAAATAIPPHR